jgi:hypothetical protein
VVREKLEGVCRKYSKQWEKVYGVKLYLVISDNSYVKKPNHYGHPKRGTGDRGTFQVQVMFNNAFDPPKAPVEEETPGA